MPKPLHIPPADENPLRLFHAPRLAVRQHADRRTAMLEADRNQRGFEGLMHCIVISTTLWGAFWIQFVTSVLSNIPAIHTFSRGYWYGPGMEIYHVAESPAGLSLAESFAFLSVFGSALAMLGAWHWSHGVRGRWRMRAMVAGFAGFLCLWSFATLAAEDAAWENLEMRHAEIQEEIRIAGEDVRWVEWLIHERVRIERMMEARKNTE